MQEDGLFAFSTYILRAFITLFWGIFLIFYLNHSKQNLPLSCIFIIIGTLYLYNAFKRFPALHACDVYNVRSYLTLIFVAPFTIFYANFALNKSHNLKRYSLHFIPFATLLGLYLLLRAYKPHIPFCYDINELLGYAAQYPLYVGYYVLLMCVFVVQVLTYFTTALIGILRIRKIHRAQNLSMSSTNKLLAMDFLFLYYPLFCLFFLSYNNNPLLGIVHNFSIAITVTALSILSIHLRLPLKTQFTFNNNQQAKNHFAGHGEEAELFLVSQIKKLFDDEEIYKLPQLNLQDIAQKLNTNRSYISACINKYCGCNFKQFLIKYRIKAAKRLLIETDFDIQEIAWEVGFNTRASFYNAFKDHISEKLSPIEWRKRLKRKTLQIFLVHDKN